MLRAISRLTLEGARPSTWAIWRIERRAHSPREISAVRVALNDRQLDRAFRALTDSTRRWIIEALLEGDASVLQLAEPFPIGLPSFLQHLKVLEECGVIRTRKEGRQRICSIEPEGVFAAERWLRRVMWARYGRRLGSLPEDHPGLRALLRS